MKTIYIIAGPNGAGKTTLSYSILPEIFHCEEFINADEIARGLSPLKPEKASFRAGRLMLERIKELIEQGETFAFETTLATKSYVSLVESAQKKGYKIVLLFLALESPELAVERVKTRVKEGGHNIPKNVVKRRFDRGLRNFFKLYHRVADRWLFVDNSAEPFTPIAKGGEGEIVINDEMKWQYLKEKYYVN